MLVMPDDPVKQFALFGKLGTMQPDRSVVFTEKGPSSRTWRLEPFGEPMLGDAYDGPEPVGWDFRDGSPSKEVVDAFIEVFTEEGEAFLLACHAICVAEVGVTVCGETFTWTCEPIQVRKDGSWADVPGVQQESMWAGVEGDWSLSLAVIGMIPTSVSYMLTTPVTCFPCEGVACSYRSEGSHVDRGAAMYMRHMTPWGVRLAFTAFHAFVGHWARALGWSFREDTAPRTLEDFQALAVEIQDSWDDVGGRAVREAEARRERVLEARLYRDEFGAYDDDSSSFL